MADVKRGDTFSPEVWFDIDGVVPADFPDWTIRSQIRSADQSAQLLHEFPVVPIDLSVGHFQLIAEKETVKQWPVGTSYEWDIEYTAPDGFRISSPTEPFRVTRDVTRTEPT